jgi:DNA repair exonuclease SbcCD nuclease subunit
MLIIDKVGFLGDVHLGRRFINGVPLHRRGERENMVQSQFFAEINTPDLDMIVQVGDLYDRFRVELNTVVRTANCIRSAALNTPETTFIFLAGNHDLAKDAEKISAFELTRLLLRDVPNAHVLMDVPQSFQGVLFVPYNPFMDATTTLSVGVPPHPEPYKAVVGHWDKVAVGDQSNLIPLDELAKLTKLVISGHDHTPDEFQHGDTRVIYTGSMQPYSHGEDPDRKLYTTMSLVEATSTYPELIKDKCVRVLLLDGEAAPDLDCLQLTTKRIGSSEDDVTVDFEDGLNMEALFVECMAGIDEDVTANVKTKLNEVRNAVT